VPAGKDTKAERHCMSCGSDLVPGRFVCRTCFHVNTCANGDLRHDDLPAEHDWRGICEFALSFNGYDHWGPSAECGARANAVFERWRADRTLPTFLSDLRAALFYEQRRDHHFGGWPPSVEQVTYCAALVQSIGALIPWHEGRIG
jgi:hypothetical protein